MLPQAPTMTGVDTAINSMTIADAANAISHAAATITIATLGGNRPSLSLIPTAHLDRPPLPGPSQVPELNPQV